MLHTTVLVLQVWCCVVKHRLVMLIVIMILKDTANFQVLFIVSLFCTWNITTVMNRGVHLLKSYIRQVLLFTSVGLGLHHLSIWPHLFCGAGHEKRRGEQLKWSLAFTLYIGSFPCVQLPARVHTARLGRVFFVYLAWVCALCSFALFDLFVCPHSFSSFPGQLSHLPYSFWC